MNIAHSTRKRATRGFSLIEVLVYLSVTVLVTLAGVLTYLSLSTTLMRNETERAVSHSAQVALERMVRDIRESAVIQTAQSTFDASPGTLSLVSPEAVTTEFSLSGGNVVLAINDVEIGSLTSDDVTVDELLFTRYGTSTELVRITLTLSASNRAASTTRTFYSSAVLRGTYE